MTYYSVHVIMIVVFEEGPQDDFPIWMNIYLVPAENADQAYSLGIKCAVDEAETTSGFTCDDRPASLRFAGVRSVWRVIDFNDAGLKLAKPIEIAAIQMQVKKDSDVSALIQGDEVPVLLDDLKF